MNIYEHVKSTLRRNRVLKFCKCECESRSSVGFLQTAKVEKGNLYFQLKHWLDLVLWPDAVPFLFGEEAKIKIS